MMTASAPSGITPPVKIRTASPAPTLALERPSRRDLADHLQPRRQFGGIGRAHRIAVHRRHRLRRLRPPRRDVAREHAVIGGIERDHFFGQRVGAGEDRGKRIGNRHQGHGQEDAPFDASVENHHIPSAVSALATSSVDVTWMATRPRARAPSILAAESSKNRILDAGTPIALTT